MVYYLTQEEVREAELYIGKKLLSIDEETIDKIKFLYIDNRRKNKFDWNEVLDNFLIDVCRCPFLGLYWENEDRLYIGEKIVLTFLKHLAKEKYYKQDRKNILTTLNNNWQRNNRRWRKSVFERDNYTCVECKTNKNLHAHHIKSRAKYPELEFDINNGITLCKSCHAKKHPTIGLLR